MELQEPQLFEKRDRLGHRFRVPKWWAHTLLFAVSTSMATTIPVCRAGLGPNRVGIMTTANVLATLWTFILVGENIMPVVGACVLVLSWGLYIAYYAVLPYQEITAHALISVSPIAALVWPCLSWYGYLRATCSNVLRLINIGLGLIPLAHFFGSFMFSSTPSTTVKVTLP
jgi:hypothetical protein